MVLNRSNDNGQSWVNAHNGIECGSVSFAANGSYLFAGAYCGVFRSSNNGQNWDKIVTGLTAAGSDSLAASGADLFGVFSGGIPYHSINGGQNWVNIFETGVPPIRYTSSFVANDTTVIAGQYGAVLLSNDKGQTWRSGTGLPQDSTIAITFSGPTIFTSTFRNGVFRSINNGQTWISASTGLGNAFVKTFATFESTTYAGVYCGGIFRSTDNGQNWIAGNSGLTNQCINALAVVGTIVFAGTD